MIENLAALVICEGLVIFVVIAIANSNHKLMLFHKKRGNFYDDENNQLLRRCWYYARKLDNQATAQRQLIRMLKKTKEQQNEKP